MSKLHINWKHLLIWLGCIIIFLICYGCLYHITDSYFINKSKSNQQTKLLHNMSVHPVMYGSTYSVPAHDFINRMYQYDEAQPYYNRVTPSLVIGQSALESDWGRSSLYKKGNNPFGVKGSYHGHSIQVRTQEHIRTKKSSGKNISITAQFKKYPNLRVAVADHNRMLNDTFLHGDIHNTYVTEAKELQQNGYATDPNYAQHIMEYVEDNNLTRFD